MTNKIVLAGSGYLGGYIKNQLNINDRIYSVIDVCRTKKIKSDAATNIIRDFDNKESDLQFMDDSTIIYMAPPSTTSMKDDRLNNFISNVASLKINKIIYTSTSGVYGNCGDEIVDEEKKLMPQTERAVRRVYAEKRLTKFAKGKNFKLIILRVPGIYGPGRLPIDRVKKREPLILPRECRTTNLIHVEDLARICVASAHLEKDLEIINVSDGNPIKTTTYYEYIYEAYSMEPPEYITFEKAIESYSKKRLSFLKESRILNVNKMRRLFPECIRFEDTRAGIRQSLLF